MSQTASTVVETSQTAFDSAPLPNGWRWVKLGDVCEVVTGSTPPKAESRFYGGTIAWIKPDDLDRAMYVDSSSEYLSDEGAKRARILPVGAVLVSCIGNVGKTAIAAKPLATNQQINSLIPSKAVDSEYLFFACRFIGSTMRAAASVSLVPIINKSSFSALKIPIPALPEQKRIAAVLKEQMAAVERARAAAEAQLETINKIPAALLRQAFTGKL
jgi:type I restriction enzyme S subunit